MADDLVTSPAVLISLLQRHPPDEICLLLFAYKGHQFPLYLYDDVFQKIIRYLVTKGFLLEYKTEM